MSDKWIKFENKSEDIAASWGLMSSKGSDRQNNSGKKVGILGSELQVCRFDL